MPNHVSTNMEVTGDDAEVQRFIDTCIVKHKERDHNDKLVRDKDGNIKTFEMFDFNTILPIPPELEKTISPVRTIEDLKRAKERGDNEEQIKEIQEQIRLVKFCKENYGCTDWYSWKTTNWGTKWGAYDYYGGQREKGLFRFSYQTAWSPATPVISKLGEMFPKLTFITSFVDEGWGYYGTHTVCGEDGIDSEQVFDCQGEDFMNFMNDEMGEHYEMCKKCERVYNPEWVEYDEGDEEEELCEDCYIEQKEQV